MKAGTWAAGIWLAICSCGVLWWTLAWGGYVAGDWSLLAWVFVAGIPLIILWLFYFSFLLIKVTRRWSLALVVVTSLATVPLMLQPWNPRVQFVRKLASLKGMSPIKAQTQMKGYLGGELAPIDGIYIPDKFSGLGITQSMSYRWNETDGRYNADVGTAYVSGNTVVATDFSPD